MRQTGRLLGDTGWLCEAILRHGAVEKPIVHTVYFLADLEAGNILTHGCNDAGELMSWYRAATSSAVFIMGGWVPQQFLRRHTSRIDANQQFASPRLRLRNVFFDQHRRLRGIRQAHDSHAS